MKVFEPRLFGLYPWDYQRTKPLLTLCEGAATLDQLAQSLGGKFHRQGYKDAADYVLRSAIPKLKRVLPSAGLQIVHHGNTYELVPLGKAAPPKANYAKTHAPPPNTDPEYLNELDSLDASRQSLARREQDFLRKRLLGGRNKGKCGICGITYPIALLVAAHIKKRSKCTDSEKRDMANVVPMCKFGCDDLFERGYFTVQKGRTAANPAMPSIDGVRCYIDRLKGRKCSCWNQKNEPYFRSHADQT